MQARGMLMIEHRLIERMIAAFRDALVSLRATNRVDPLFVDAAVDFFRVYADQTHHGKEEDILFRKLKQRPLSGEDRKRMEELIREHVLGRETTRALAEANARYRNGDEDALSDVVENIRVLVDVYPKHIEKEDKVFFPASRAYFSEEEDQAMLAEFQEYDGRMIHEKYKAVVEGLESPG